MISLTAVKDPIENYNKNYGKFEKWLGQFPQYTVDTQAFSSGILN